MATNFPTSIDSFTNPTSGDTLDSPSHAAQHANINDAMVAVQTKLGVGSGTIGTWTTYTPTLTNWTLGNGSISARYARVQNFVMVTCDITTGTTTNVTGTGMQISLPVTANAGRANAPLGPVWFYDGSNQYYGQVGGVSTTSVMFNLMDAGGTYVGITYTAAGVPFTWNAVRSVYMTFVYEGS